MSAGPPPAPPAAAPVGSASATPQRSLPSLRRRRLIALAAYAAFAALLVLWAPYIGGSDAPSDKVRQLVLDMRRARAWLAAAAGGGLALAGVMLQSLLRNPLATPFTLGISSGASLGAVLVITIAPGLGLLAGLGRTTLVTGGSMAGALAALAIAYAIAHRRRGVATETLLLAGVAVSTFCGAVILFLLYSADPSQTVEMLRWLMGAIPDDPARGWRAAAALGAFVTAGLAFAMVFARDLNVMVSGDDVAAGRGVDVERLRIAIYLTSGLVTALVVATTGPIGFVGLVIPHFCRLLTGPDHRLLAPAACLAGAGYLAACDALARSLFYPTELPVGILTAAIGGPAFVWLLVRRQRDRE